MKRVQVDGARSLSLSETRDTHGSNVFAPFRTVGRVSDGLPHSLFYLGGVPYVATGLEHSFQILDVESLNVAFLSSRLDARLLSLTHYREQSLVFCEDGTLCLFDRAKLQASVQLSPSPSTFVTMQLFGEQLVVLYEKSLLLVEIPSLALQCSIPLQVPEGSKATCFCHPITYTNKVVVAFGNGAMQVVNVKSGKLVYEFKECSFDAFPVCIVASPVVDIVAAGLDDGSVWICDVKKDLKLFRIGQGSSSRVCTISFRSDPHECRQLVVGHADGRLALWDLEGRMILDYWKSHEASPRLFATFVQGQPLIVSSSGDNAIKQWIVEEGRVRLLKSRSGHSAPPTSLQFYGDEGSAIISAAPDKALRLVSLIKDSQSVELSQGHVDSISRRAELLQSELKLEPVTVFGVFTTKELKWDNLVSVHEESPVAHTWRVDHRKLGGHELRSQDGSNFTAVCMSSCGNYALLGCATGSIDVFNLQSGHHRRHIQFPHAGSDRLVGLGVDPSNSYIVAVHESGRLCCYEFHNGRARFEHEFADRVSCSHFYANGEVLAVAHPSDFSITLFDVEGRQVARRLKGHDGPISDLAISSNGKWLVSSSQDRTVRTWDIATSLLIDVLRLPDTPTAIALSPTQTHLAVALKDDVAVHLWTNLSLYRPVALLPTPALSLTTRRMERSVELDRLNEELLTLSLGPRTKFLDMVHIEEVSARSRPQLSSGNTPEKTSFFLDSFLAKRSAAGEEVEKTRPMEESGLVNDGRFRELVLSDREEDWVDAFSLLQTMSPGQAAFEISTLVVPGEDGRGLLNCLRGLEHQLHKGSNWELVVACLDKLITCHAELIRARPQALGEAVDRIGRAFEERMRGLEAQFHDALFLCAFAREH